jgi:hypothetical protein
MKKRTKTLIASIGCFVLAGAAFGGAAACGFFNRDKWAAANANISARWGYNEAPIAREYSAADTVGTLEIDLQRAELILQRGDTDTVKVEYAERFDGEFTVTESDGGLKVTQSGPKAPFNFELGWVLDIFDGEWSNYRVFVTVPRDAQLNGAVLATSYGRIICGGISVDGKLTASADSGMIEIYDCAFGSAELTSVSGPIKMEYTDVAGGLGLKVSSGSAKLTDVTAGAVSVQSSSGGTHLTRVECADFTGRSSSGGVTLYACAVKTIDYTVSSGSFKITGLRDASALNTAFDIVASSGSIRVFGENKRGGNYYGGPTGDAPISIKVRLSSGSFNIE